MLIPSCPQKTIYYYRCLKPWTSDLGVPAILFVFPFSLFLYYSTPSPLLSLLANLAWEASTSMFVAHSLPHLLNPRVSPHVQKAGNLFPPCLYDESLLYNQYVT